MVQDWGSPDEEGYYESGFRQSSVIQRLLMYGASSTEKGDLPTGPIYGITRTHTAWDDLAKRYWEYYDFGMVPVGISCEQFHLPNHQ